MMNSYEQLEKYFSRMSALDHASAILDWDEAVMMPTRSASARAKAQSEIKVMKHEILNSAPLTDLIPAVELNYNQLNPWQQANLREIKSLVNRARAVSKDLVEAYSLASSECQQAWRTMRSENNWNDFLPLFEKLVGLAKEDAHQRSEKTKLSPYDSLLDLYSPGITHKKITEIFDPVKLFLPNLIQQIMEYQKSTSSSIDLPPTTSEQQKVLGIEIMKTLGFDFSRGRLDTSHHPFCGGVSQDVRITTRYNSTQFIESLMGVIHEAGHALYEQNLPEKWSQQPVGLARGMDIHESQSLFFENIIGRSKAFYQYLYPLIKKYLYPNEKSIFQEGQSFDLSDSIYQNFNQVKKSLIRVNADEVTYPMHIILRHEIEHDLISGSLLPKDLPDVWDHKMQTYLGLSTKNDFKNGCMQDIHWPSGAFGYFPSYTLGAMLAAQLSFAIKREHPRFEQDLTHGDFTFVTNWLKDKIWSQGSLLNSQNLILQATGEPLSPQYFKNYLEDKYLLPQ